VSTATIKPRTTRRSTATASRQDVPPIAERLGEFKGRYAVWCVEKPTGWTPLHPQDTPPCGSTFEEIEANLTKQEAEGLLWGFNCAAMARPSKVWAIIVRGPSRAQLMIEAEVAVEKGGVS
jgi:hypothetical protein